jgi:hypothetical protein
MYSVSGWPGCRRVGTDEKGAGCGSRDVDAEPEAPLRACFRNGDAGVLLIPEFAFTGEGRFDVDPMRGLWIRDGEVCDGCNDERCNIAGFEP